jgi:hypothetical protein
VSTFFAARAFSLALVVLASACSEKFSSAESPAAAANVPADGMLLWIRADEGVTQQGGHVSRWDDVSPNHMRAVQDDAGSKPSFQEDALNGKPAVIFDGEDDALQFGSGFSDFSAGLSLFGVFEREDTDVCGAMLEASNDAEIDDISFGLSSTQLNYEVLENTEQGTSYPALVPVQFSIVHRTDETVEIRRNGLFGSRGGFALPATIERQAIYVGKSLYGGCPSFNGKIAEIIAYDRELTDDDVQFVEQYLQKKYGCCSP